MHASLIHSCTTCRGNKKHWLIFHPSPFSSKERTTMFLIDLRLEDKWEHPKFCGLEINVHKARKMGNVIKWIVCTVSEVQKKRPFSYPGLSWQTATVSQPLFQSIPLSSPTHGVSVCLTMVCTDRSLVHFFFCSNYFFGGVVNNDVFPLYLKWLPTPGVGKF